MGAALRYDSSFGRPQLRTSCITSAGMCDVLVWCVTHQPFHARQQPVPSRLTTAPAGTTPSGAHRAIHPQYRPGDLPAFQLWQVQQEGRVFYPQVLGPRLWWRALRQGLAMLCTSGPMISSKFTLLYDQ